MLFVKIDIQSPKPFGFINAYMLQYRVQIPSKLSMFFFNLIETTIFIELWT